MLPDEPNSPGAPAKPLISLSEVLISLAVVLALAAIVWPKMLRSRLEANESVAVATLREINEAELSYAATYPAVGFARNLKELGGKTEGCLPAIERACLLDGVATAPYAKRGYVFSADGVGEMPRTSFYSTGVPEHMGLTGQLSFCSGNRGWAIHYRDNGRPGMDFESCDALPLVH